MITYTNMDEIINHIKESDSIMQHILKEACDELLVAKQVEKITRVSTDMTRKKALIQVVEKQSYLLNQAFLIALNAYIKMSRDSRFEDVEKILMELKEVVLEVVLKGMHPQIQHLEKIMLLPIRVERLAWLDNFIQIL